MLGDCHMHMILDGVYYRDAIDMHKGGVVERVVREILQKYADAGVTFLRDGGRLSVAHGMSREDLLKLHNERASEVSLELPEANELSKIFEQFFNTDIIISDSEMYQVSGIKK